MFLGPAMEQSCLDFASCRRDSCHAFVLHEIHRIHVNDCVEIVVGSLVVSVKRHFETVFQPPRERGEIKKK